ncbi:hypothetical protein K461DRAFT_289614 [Myriangium duriaei CBS 260.36]|uniref:PB1 domain-containing protein n=1 Tax=Myriangium duriaei CBS 260.36 TaxID=1168546 RepID=A0A9P4JEA9_9PEZI|nr:hypothetical protein K461DRAFT_289614 [Myriangium duriaei CBS 260.36]
MSLKQEIETWVEALVHYDNQDYEAALSAFGNIADTSKILFNCGVIYATLGEHGRAIDCYQRAVHFDQYLAVSYFQQGVSNFLCGDFEEALANFNDTLLYLRGNRFIDYEQLGLQFKLHSCEALFNRGLCFIYTQQKDMGMQDLIFAAREKAVPDHSVIDDAIRDHAEGYTVFSIPVGVVYRPNEAKVKNLRAKDYLPRARLVAQQQQQHKGHRRQFSAQDLSPDDRHDLSWAAMNMVKPGLSTRMRQQSEPPMSRSMFPPTPPPDSEKPFFPEHSRQKDRTDSPISFKQGVPERLQIKPPKLDLGSVTFQPSHPGTAHSAPEKTQRHNAKSADGEDPFTLSRLSLRENSTANGDPSPVTPDMSQQGICYRHSKSQTVCSAGQPYSIDEDPEAEEAEAISPSSSTSSSSSADPTTTNNPTFELVTPPRHRFALRDSPVRPSSVPRSQLHRQNSNTTIAERRRAGSLSRTRHGESRGRGRVAPPETKRVRVKLRAEGELRFALLDADSPFVTAVDTIRAKLGIPADKKTRIRFKDDEGDMVTLADDEDWVMALEGSKRLAREEWERGSGEGGETAKLELWVG